MRVVQNNQMNIGEVDISKIVFDPKSRDDIPQILRGLQFLYTRPGHARKLFQLLESDRTASQQANGRPGMALWPILVCGVIRLDLNCDYDRLHELVNHHDTLREMLGHGTFDRSRTTTRRSRTTSACSPRNSWTRSTSWSFNAGHVLVKKKDGEALRGRCDSFVLETNVHYPTDINLLIDALRKVITLTAQWCDDLGLTDWRQHAYNVRHVKRLMRSAQNKKRSKATSAEREEQNEALIDHRASAVSEGRPSVPGQGPPDPGPDRNPGRGRPDRSGCGNQKSKGSWRTPTARLTRFIAASFWVKSSRRTKKSSRSLNPTPNGSARGKPASRWNWASRCASSKTSTNSSCTIR